ncbi:cytochrome P450 [Mobilicoccus pelagius]|uniref:Putative cytochrome P450 n=1 Tax=Mobilicoccus pelagius NBRC 104925 TaxID=1089455 RepID=H5UUE8_9MICO|nr:cytochrome P450 [Mobilicoccus pelagius]GAB49356.1 putative cytochrome P450 [Mobilicoccus pelagius NBRC 104925]
MTTSCPHGAHARRKTSRPGEVDLPEAPAIEVVDGAWHVRSLPLVKEVLRSTAATVQAGFNVDMMREGTARGGQVAMRDPILFTDGPEHRRQRSMIARYFAPATVSRRYGDLMSERADAIVAHVRAELAAGRRVELSEIALGYSVAVAAAVIGLTESDTAGMARRLERLFSIPWQPPRPRDAEADPEASDAPANSPTTVPARLAARFAAIANAATSMKAAGGVGLFYLKDVRPAVRARREHPQEDVVSHLLEQGYTDPEITTECVTYGAAGMVTTREYLCVVAWHLLEDDALRRRYLAADETERHAMLHEILRLEPVVGHLYRRAVEPLTLVDGGTTHVVPVGAVLDLSIRGANADPEHVGADPLGLCPGRTVGRGVRPEGMSFGDGAHRCPGNSLAIAETDVLLTRLLALPITLADGPELGWLDLIAGYEVRDMELGGAPDAHNTPRSPSTY